MLVRAARAEEMARIGDLRVRFYDHAGLLAPDYVEPLRRLGRSGPDRVLVAVDGEEMLGTVVFRPFGEGSEIARVPDEGEVRALAVAPEAQGGGVGRRLVRAVVDVAREDGVRHLVLSTQTTMHTAQRLYAAEGFVRLPDRDWSPHPGVDLIAYGLVLPGS